MIAGAGPGDDVGGHAAQQNGGILVAVTVACAVFEIAA